MDPKINRNTGKHYIVELEGFNDGHPYVVSRHATSAGAYRSAEDHRKSNPKVRYRVIHELEEFSH